MTLRSHDPRRLDVAAFAAEGSSLQGNWPLAGMTRLLESIDAASDAAPTAGVMWHASGAASPARGRTPRAWLQVSASAEVVLTCQRCLGPLAVALRVARRFGFVGDEAEAAALDAESEDDVLKLERSFDLHALIEDELLLALPLVPRHADCSPPAVKADEALGLQAPQAHPFAALDALRRHRH